MEPFLITLQVPWTNVENSDKHESNQLFVYNNLDKVDGHLAVLPAFAIYIIVEIGNLLLSQCGKKSNLLLLLLEKYFVQLFTGMIF